MIRRRLFAGAAGLLAPAVVRAEGIMRLAPARVVAPKIPVGTILAFGEGRCPAGWLPCDGRAISSAIFPELAILLAGPGGSPARLPRLLPPAVSIHLQGDHRPPTPITVDLRFVIRAR